MSSGTLVSCPASSSAKGAISATSSSRIVAIGAVNGDSAGDVSTRRFSTGGGAKNGASGAATGPERAALTTRERAAPSYVIAMRSGAGSRGGPGMDPRPGSLAPRGGHLLLEPLDGLRDVAVAGLEAAIQLQLLDRFDLVALREVDLGQLANRDQVLAIEPECARERADGAREPVQLLIGPSEGDVRRHRGGVQLEPALESDDGVAILPVAAVLLRERQELARRRVLLKEPFELLQT